MLVPLADTIKQEQDESLVFSHNLRKDRIGNTVKIKSATHPVGEIHLAIITGAEVCDIRPGGRPITMAPCNLPWVDMSTFIIIITV